jgi:PilZ domain
VEEAYPQPEPRSQARHAVDVEASLAFLDQCGMLRGRMFELGPDGCGLRTHRPCTFDTPAAVEMMFKLNGIEFCLAGTVERVDRKLTAAVEFSPMDPGSHAALMDALAEIETVQQPRAWGESANPPGGAPSAEFTGAAVFTVSTGPQRSDRPPIEGEHAERGSLHGDNRPPIPFSRGFGRERRAQNRHTVNTHATLFFIDARTQIPGRIVDVSKGGCRIRADEPLPVGIYRRVETEFKLDGMPFRLAGVVQSLHDNFTAGIRFLDISARKREQLEELMGEIATMKHQAQQEL